jgi:tRNA-Thr(GGU) m(6)t(6)A37 methyltransferase TsaA
MQEIHYRPIGIIHSPFPTTKGVPIQPGAAVGVAGIVEVFAEYAEGLLHVDGFSHVMLCYHFHLSKGACLHVTPFLDDHLHGVFATRAPSRPNPIGISIVRLVCVQGNSLHILDVDIVDGTPLLDIKPYVPAFDIREVTKSGWLENKVCQLSTAKDDGRFSE